MKQIVFAMAICLYLQGFEQAIAEPTPAAVCALFNQAIETNAKNLAYIYTRTFVPGETAAQNTERAAEEANAIALIQLNLDLMAGNKCPLPSEPITRGTFMQSALACYAASTKQDTITKCDRANWRATPNAQEPSVVPEEIPSH